MSASVYENKAGAAAAPLLGALLGGSSYQRRQPEKTVLYQMVADEFATFREEVFEDFMPAALRSKRPWFSILVAREVASAE
jgi:hypothetical protein